MRRVHVEAVDGEVWGGEGECLVDVLALGVSTWWGVRRGGVERGHTSLDHLFDAHAQLIFLAVGAFDWGEGRVDAICCGASHIVD